jgi:hypothetical protein
MNIIIAALATWQIIEIWRHSLLFAPLRSVTEMWVNKLGELLSCPFCLSPWVAMICLALLQVQDYGLAGLVGSLTVKAFATSRLANLGNDFFKQWTLTPKVTFDYDRQWEEGDSVG